MYPDTLSTAVLSCNPDLNFSLPLAADPAVNVAVRSMSSLQSAVWWVCELEGLVKESCRWQMVKSNASVLLEGKEA